MDPTGKDLAFIVGHYKAGSSWLDNLLSGHPWVRGLSETHVFRYTATVDLQTCTRQLFTKTAWSQGGLGRLPRHRVATWLAPIRRRWRQALDPSDRPATLLDLSLRDHLAFKRYLRESASPDDYCRRFFEFLFNRLKPRRYLLEKTPTNILYVPQIRSIFPRAKLIAVYRDGRDVVVSDRHFCRNTGVTYSFVDSIESWRQSMEAHFKYVDSHSIFTCSYESLLSDGPGVVHRLLTFLDLPSDDATVERMLRQASFEFITGRKPGEENQRQFYRKGVSGDWRNHFGDTEKQTFKRLAGDMLVRLGYEQDQNWC